MDISKLRVGIGYDVHSLVKGSNVVLGGVKIPHYKTITAHSDGDLLTHAIMDAILGASGSGDIGHHFPDSSDEFSGISSLELLKQVKKIVKKKNFTIINIDSVIIAQEPKLDVYIKDMKSNISEIIGLDLSSINIKATTTEKNDSFGREDAIGAQAVVLGFFS